jgi:signal recognition particle GTPase
LGGNARRVRYAKNAPTVILLTGLQGAGKTSLAGKLANYLKNEGNTPLLVAADLQRPNAVTQLQIVGQSIKIPVFAPEPGNGVGDPVGVARASLKFANEKLHNFVIIDTAGRLHNKVHLMDELNKIMRVIQKQLPEAPHEVLLVLDGSTGQNALEQAKQFMAVTNVNALAITKLDGTAKGGVVLAIAHQCKIPVKYIGVGEQIHDLVLFDKNEFVDSLFSLKKE